MTVQLPLPLECTPYPIPETLKLLKAIEDAGYRKLGSGAFGTVYGHDERDLVLKHADNGLSDGWVHYVRWLYETKPNNPHFPLVHWVGRMGDKPNSPWFALMERLTEARKWGFANGYGEYDVQDLYFKARIAAKERIGGARWASTGVPALDAACDLMFGAFRELNLTVDLHHANVMFRGDVCPANMVITDPYSYVNSPAEY